MKRSYVAVTGATALLWALVAQAAPTTEEKLEVLSEELEQLKAEVAKQQGEQPAGSHADRTTVGGYGELHYNNWDSKKEIDFHRFVLYFGHRFSDRIRFHSELELEHSNTESGGAVELEQAYLEFDLTDRLRARGGLFLMPVGIINETHEPPTFYGVERNPVETYVIPSTWWEGGAGVSVELAAGLRFDATMTSGLEIPVTGPDAYNIRESRQNVANAPADSFGYAGRLRWSALPGVELAASIYYQSDVTQSAAGTGPIAAVLGEAHAIIGKGPFALKALYAQWTLNDTDPAGGPDVTGQDEQKGWYLEPAFRIGPQWGLFARYSEWDLAGGKAGTGASLSKQTDVGVNYWPHPQVVIKFDVRNQEGAVSDDGYNLGIGYMF